jgi:hypothetical protein
LLIFPDQIRIGDAGMPRPPARYPFDLAHRRRCDRVRDQVRNLPTCLYQNVDRLGEARPELMMGAGAGGPRPPSLAGLRDGRVDSPASTFARFRESPGMRSLTCRRATSRCWEGVRVGYGSIDIKALTATAQVVGDS